MRSRSFADRVSGALLCVITVLVICNEWGLARWTELAKPLLVMLVVPILAAQVRPTRQAFVAVAVLLSLALAATNPGWRAIAVDGLVTSAFIAAFFTALSTLRTVAETSPAIQRAGAFLAGQRPGRRYAALTAGGRPLPCC
ncbi:hypothetical protein ABWH93_00870 [Seohaeicola saemankumensis]|uniref:hypothetical protein n=1 Tax=Seohaeicola saemankumensis TaxID=481181 RepID=UPI0035D10D83